MSSFPENQNGPVQQHRMGSDSGLDRRRGFCSMLASARQVWPNFECIERQSCVFIFLLHHSLWFYYEKV